MRRYFGSLLPLYGADDTLLDSPGSFFRVMSCSPKFAGSPGSSSGGFSPFSDHIASKIGMRNIWFLKDKQAVVEEYEQTSKSAPGRSVPLRPVRAGDLAVLSDVCLVPAHLHHLYTPMVENEGMHRSHDRFP